MNRSAYLDHVLHFYNRHARAYDLGEALRRGTRRKAVALSGVRPGDRVLDVCTGTGELALAFARQGAEVVGIDIAEGMLERASVKSPDSNPKWMKMDASQMTFDDSAFDIAALSLALHHMPEAIQRGVLAEIGRVTRRRVVIVEPHTPTDPAIRTLWGFVFSVIDESEHMHDWARQDFHRTCADAGLEVEGAHMTSLGIHRITLCRPCARPA